MQINKKAIVGILFASIFAFSVVPYFNVSAQSAKCNPDALKPVSYGQRGAAVKNAQACLIEAGYNIPAGATGYYGAQTKNAVKKFYADWYGKSTGSTLGPQGIKELKSRLAAASEEEEEEQAEEPSTGSQTGGSQTGGQQGGVSQDQLMQVLQLLSQGRSSDALAVLMALLTGQQIQLPAQTTTPSTQQSTQEGTLTVERHSNPTSNVPLREGETQVVMGIRFRATQGDVSVQRIRIDWPTTAETPYRVLSRVELIDESGNSLWSANVTSNEGQPFYRETSGQYYLLLTGLNFNVPRDTTKVVYLRATAVSTYPSGVSGNPIMLTVPVQGVRAVTAGGSVNLFEPGTVVQNSFLPQGTLASSAQLSVVRTSDTPQERNVVANELVSGTGTAAIMRVTNDVPLLKVRLTAQNDTMRLRQVVATFTANGFAGSGGGPVLFYLEIDGRKVGNVTVNAPTTTFADLFQENISIPAGSSKDAIIGVSRVEGVDYDGADVTVSLVSVTAENSLGSTSGSFSGLVTSEVTRFFNVAPTFAFQNAAVTAVRDQSNNTTTLSFTGKIAVSLPSNVHAGGQVRISSSTPFDLQWERSNTTTATTVSYTIASVRDSSNNVVSQSGGYYVLNAGDTYYFELTAQITFSGAPQGRVRVNSITWRPGNSGTFISSDITSAYVSRDFVTGWSN